MSLLDIMKKVADEKNQQADKTGIVFATVTSVNPVEILIDGYSESIPQDFIILSPFCIRCVLPKPHKHNDIAPDTPQTDTETEEIEMWRAIEAGDRVICQKTNEGQTYYILQRVEMECFR